MPWPSIRTFFYLISSEIIVVNNTEWIRRYPVLTKLKGKRVQLWHGVGFKFVGKLREQKLFSKKLSTREKKLFEKSYPRDDLFVTNTSRLKEGIEKDADSQGRSVSNYVNYIFSKGLSIPANGVSKK